MRIYTSETTFKDFDKLCFYVLKDKYPHCIKKIDNTKNAHCFRNNGHFLILQQVYLAVLIS